MQLRAGVLLALLSTAAALQLEKPKKGKGGKKGNPANSKVIEGPDCNRAFVIENKLAHAKAIGSAMGEAKGAITYADKMAEVADAAAEKVKDKEHKEWAKEAAEEARKASTKVDGKLADVKADKEATDYPGDDVSGASLSKLKRLTKATIKSAKNAEEAAAEAVKQAGAEKLEKQGIELPDLVLAKGAASPTCPAGYQPLLTSDLATCNTIVTTLSQGKPIGRPNGMQNLEDSGTCPDKAWGQVPFGCSAQTGGDGTAHLKNHKGDTGDCASDHYQLVCTRGPPVLILAKGAASPVCPEGYEPLTGDLAACNAAVTTLAEAKNQRIGRPEGTQNLENSGTCSDKAWGIVPVGCSAQTGGDWAAHLKTHKGDTGDCSSEHYQLVCKLAKKEKK